MKLKKYITLLLSALMLVYALTACGPSVEHRFDTEEYSARAEATMRSIAQQLGRVESLANGHSVELYAAFAEYEDGRPGRPDGDVTVTTVTQDALNDWAARPRISCVSTPRAAMRSRNTSPPGCRRCGRCTAP